MAEKQYTGKNNKKRAIFLDRDGVINFEGDELITKPDDLKLFEFSSRAIQKINAAGYLAIIITNQSVIARNLCSIETLEIIHKKLEDELSQKGAAIDKIYYCPHYPNKRIVNGNIEYLTDCECRKPKIGMITEASRDFSINLQQSYFIGDDERDIICGNNAGVTTIGVLTGKGMKNSKIQPDYIFENIEEAVNFIISIPINS